MASVCVLPKPRTSEAVVPGQESASASKRIFTHTVGNGGPHHCTGMVCVVTSALPYTLSTRCARSPSTCREQETGHAFFESTACRSVLDSATRVFGLSGMYSLNGRGFPCL